MSKRKKSLIGYVYPAWVMRYDDTVMGKCVVHSDIMKKRVEITKFPHTSRKVRITIEEL